MRALVVRGFCIGPCHHAEIGQVVDLPEGFYREMLVRGSVEPAPPELPAAPPEPPALEPVEPAAEPPAAKPSKFKS